MWLERTLKNFRYARNITLLQMWESKGGLKDEQ